MGRDPRAARGDASLRYRSTGRAGAVYAVSSERGAVHEAWAADHRAQSWRRAQSSGPSLQRQNTTDFGTPHAESGTVESDLGTHVDRFSAAPQPAALEAYGLGGLAGAVQAEQQDVACRVFLLDNSGSTAKGDGHVVQVQSGCRVAEYPATRWEEIADLARQQAHFNAALGTPCEFVLLNPGRDRGVCQVRGPGDLRDLERFLQRQPRGPTPLVDRLRDAVFERHVAGRRDPRKVAVCIITDGLPTTKGGESDRDRFVAWIRRLSAEGVLLTLCLCTDDDNVVEFYNDLDGAATQQELCLDVLDDLAAEAREVRGMGNGWLTYAPSLHLIRQGGTLLKVLDLLDERPLAPAEVYQLCSLLVGEALPREPGAMVRAVAEGLRAKGLRWYDPLTKQFRDPVNEKALLRAMQGRPKRSAACTLM